MQKEGADRHSPEQDGRLILGTAGEEEESLVAPVPSSRPSSPRETGPAFTFREYSEESKLEWADFVERCDEAWLGHLPDFIDAGTGPGKGTNKSFSIRYGKSIVGVCVLSVERSGLGRILSGAGPAILAEFRHKSLLRILEAELLRRAAELRCCAIRFSISPCAPANWQARYVSSYLTEFDFSYGAHGFTLDCEGGYYVVSDLNRSEDEIFKSFTKGNKALVKKCGRAALTAECVDASDDGKWSEFVSMYKSMCSRRLAVPWNDGWLEFLRRQTELGRYKLFNSYQDGVVCASILMSSYKNSINYYAAGCTPDALSLGAMVHLHFEAMKIAKRMGYKYYFVGYVIPILRQTELGKILAFKAHLGNERWDMLNGDWIIDRRRYYIAIMLPRMLAFQVSTVPVLKTTAKAVRRALAMLKRRVSVSAAKGT